MAEFIDLTGQKFGRWIVVERAANGKGGGARWLCKCTCGVEREVASSSLQKGNSKSCGCLARELTSGRRLMDLIGQQFGRLTVLERAENGKQGQPRWLCQCSCGKELVVWSQSLRNGNSESCGCLARELSSKRCLIELAGKRFGGWTVIEQAENSKDGKACWLCECDCGKRGTVVGVCLRDGRSRSCGCLTRELQSLPKGEAAFNALLSGLKGNARRRKYKWGLTKEEVRVLTKQDCHYCGIEPRQVSHRCSGDYIYNGIDRQDNRRGYEIDNVVPCCKTCNWAKNTMAVEEFETWIRQVCNHISTWKTSPITPRLSNPK